MANPLLNPLKKLPTDKKLSRAEKRVEAPRAEYPAEDYCRKYGLL